MASIIMLKLFVCLWDYYNMLVDFIFSLYWDGKREAIPDLDKKFRFLAESATSLAKKIREKQLKSEDLVTACIKRIKIVNPIINAVTDERYNNALEDARNVDKQIEAGLSEEEFKKKPYLGVPFTAKESHAVEGMLHTLGILSRRHIRAHEDAECVRLMKEAGAILLAVSNVPEINKWQETRNLLHGQTNNPYHSGRTVGGSSGGEASLVASLASPIGLCSDIGGSTRMPAFYCGLFGHNPTPGVVNMKGSTLRTGLEEDSMVSCGVVAKHCEDLAPLTKILAGEKASELKLDREVSFSDIKFYYVETSGELRCTAISKDLQDAMRKALLSISSSVLSGEQEPRLYRHPALAYSYSLWRHAMTREPDSFPHLLANGKAAPNGILELVKKVLGLSAYTLAAIFKLLDEQVLPQVDARWAEGLTQQLKEDLMEKLGQNAVLVYPSAPQPAPPHCSAFLRPFNFAYWGIFNVLKFPATQVPLGLNDQGLPLGVQVVSAPYNDALCLKVAQYLETRFGGYVPPCKVLG